MEEGARALQAALPAAVSAVQHAHGVTATNGNVVLAGGNVSIQKHTHIYAITKHNILSALRLIRNFRKIHQDVLAKATPGTGIWLLRTEMFILWLDPNGNLKILWGTGIPGAGKTVMASIVINELEDHAAAAGGSICVCYVYFRYSDDSELTVRSVLEILVKQTVERHPEWIPLIEKTYSRHLEENTQPAEAELLKLLQQFSEGKSATFYVLEALDEAPDKLQLDLVKKLAALNVRLFITSRTLKGVESRIAGVRSFSIAAQAEDIELHINKGIERSPDLQGLLQRAGSSLRDEIVSSIIKNCDGMFLHASLQLDAVSECLSPGEVRRTLKAFPPNLNEVYRQTWDRVLKRNPSRVPLAKSVLLWVLNAPRSMTIQELERGVATSPKTYKFQPDEVMPGTSLVSLCRGLVTFEEESRVVRLVHYTAKETLHQLLCDSFPQPQSHLLAVCLTHLAKCGFQGTTLLSEESFTAALKADPLLAYASDTWASYARQSLHIEEARYRTVNFVRQIKAFPTFTSPEHPEYFDILSPLHVLSLHNLPLSLLAFEELDNPNTATQLNRASPLMLASWHGHVGPAASLLAHSKILINLVDNDGWSALMFAARAGCEGAVATLLAHPEIQVNWFDNDRWSAFRLAARYGHVGIIKLLLAHPGIQVDLVDDEGWTTLMLAARYGHREIVVLLLSHSKIQAQVNMVDSKGWSALMKAANHGHTDIVDLLLACRETRINIVDNKKWSALMLAARYGHVGAVASLVANRKIQLNLVDHKGWSALMLAAYNGHQHIIRLLLAHIEIQVNLIHHEGWSALMLAARYGHHGIVKLFLEYPKIRVNLADSHGQLALTLAVRHDHVGAVAALVACSETQVNMTDDEGWSALMLAAYQGNEAIARLLLAVPRINIWTRSREDGYTAMSIALAHGYLGIAQLLHKHDSEHPNSTSMDPDPTRIEHVEQSTKMEVAKREELKGGNDFYDYRGPGQQLEAQDRMESKNYEHDTSAPIPRANRRSPPIRPQRQDVVPSSTVSSFRLHEAPRTPDGKSLLHRATSFATQGPITSLPVPSSESLSKPSETSINSQLRAEALTADAQAEAMSWVERVGMDAMDDEDVSDAYAENGPPGLRTSMKRPKDNEANGYEFPVDDMAPPASKRHRGAAVGKDEAAGLQA